MAQKRVKFLKCEGSKMNTNPGDQSQKMVSILYTNYRGETAIRRIIPQRIWYGKTDWHPKEQWLLDAFDIEKQADRTFAMKDVRSWFLEE